MVVCFFVLSLNFSLSHTMYTHKQRLLCLCFVKEHKRLLCVHTCEHVCVHCVHPWTQGAVAGVARTTQGLSEIVKQLPANRVPDFTIDPIPLSSFLCQD